MIPGLSGLWGKLLAFGAIVGGILLGVMKIFATGKEAGQREAIEETERASNEYEGRADEARRAGEIREREVKREDNPVDIDRYR